MITVGEVMSSQLTSAAFGTLFGLLLKHAPSMPQPRSCDNSTSASFGMCEEMGCLVWMGPVPLPLVSGELQARVRQWWRRQGSHAWLGSDGVV
ncbi:hypothetical protein BC826DRAFT_1188746 [Russula brevipes]|nr:hypothetical protein BC826DRAFT_1188746 [Russula brevipes]